MSGRSDDDIPELGHELRPTPRLLDMAPWLVVGCGVGAMIFLFVAATAGVPGGRPGDAGSRPGLSPAWPFDPDTGRTGALGDGSPRPPESVPASSSAAVSGSPGPSVTAARRGALTTRPAPTRTRPGPPAGPPPPPPPATVTGRYRVMSSFADSFIGEVLVANNGQSDRQWTVELRFPSNVGGLRTAWVESAPQATLRRSGDRYVFTSTAPVAAGASVPLRFHFDRSGRGETPTECVTSGNRCVIA